VKRDKSAPACHVSARRFIHQNGRSFAWLRMTIGRLYTEV